MNTGHHRAISTATSTTAISNTPTPPHPHSSATYSTIADMLNSCCYDGALVSPTFTATSGAVEIITNPSIHNIIFAKNTATNVVVPIDVSCKTEPYAGKVYALDNGLTLELVSAVLMNGVALTDELDVAKFCNVLAREGTG